ncbi:haloacid dehalogenase type II [Acuticoccus sp.]|uniref:haloacid dehalogenase type II n=1 Tax=Acuticoccus sp. TaxID=1904378 RepID=UPI003B51F2C4
MSQLGAHTVLSFDCYGTLIDWESGIVEALHPLTDRLSEPPSRDEVLEAHARLESAHQALTPARPYRDILATVYRRLAEGWRLEASHEEAEAYGRSVARWPAFPDSAAALRRLKARHRLVILSNVDNASFAGSARVLGVAFDAVYTAEDVGSYKPSAANFAYMLARLAERGVAPGDVLHVAESLFHDHVPATRLGLATCWIHRRHGQEGFGATMDPGERPRVDHRFTSMAALADALAPST